MNIADVAIIGAGPAGMFLAHLLHQQGYCVVVLEHRSRPYVEARVRAGVLEQGTVDLLHQLGAGSRAGRDGLRHEGVNIAVDGKAFRIDLAELTSGRAVTVYGQQAVMHDLFELAERERVNVLFEVDNIKIDGIDGEAVQIRWQTEDGGGSAQCKFIAGCDGTHGVSHRYLANARRFEHRYPFAWLGILADVPPAHEELIYGWHADGFTLASMRSPSRSRYYVQVDADTPLAAWPEARIWDEICNRLGPRLSVNVTRGNAFETSIAPLRSLVTEPMSYKRLFLAGDAAHIVPPTGAKGLNLAVSDVIMLAQAFSEFFRNGSEQGLRSYSSRALQRVWQAQRFSWWFTRLTHRMPDQSAYARRLQAAELEQLRTSAAQQRVFAENYVGLPMQVYP